MARLDSFLRLVLDQKASDLHFTSGSKPTIRHNGDLVHIPFRELGERETRRFLYEILQPKQIKEFEEHADLDFAYSLEGEGRFRVNMFRQRNGLGAVFRIIPSKIPTISEIGLPHQFRKIIDFSNGLVLFTGPTGSGKTTTQAALISEINRSRPRHIITIEDPIEFIHQPIRSELTQRQVHKHVKSFHAALRSALREAPDVLLIGEMRDLETINLAISAAETGVLVFGTLHTGSAARSIDRMIDAYPDEQADQIRGVLSVVVRALVSQRLVKLASGEGRVAALEILFNNTAVANMIREGKTHQIESYLQTIDASTGMQSLDKDLLRLVRDRQLAYPEAHKHATYPIVFQDLAMQEGLIG
ncbi:MAG: PilT/PilU family type 4a pilus ATPase [Proteobacteria bacterium]|nr:PilT/PilU family type 4a pilus ATPase [Pseudomonadota bacterium]